MSKLILSLYVLATSLGLVLLKLGSKDGLPVKYLEGKLHANVNLYTIFGIILYGLSFALYLYLISKNDLGYIIPLTTALVYILIFIASYFVFHEVFTITKVIGISLIVAGLIFLNFKR